MSPARKRKTISVDTDIARHAALYRLTSSADAQRQAATALHDAVSFARDLGMSWQEMADVLGMPRETLYRQHTGGPVVVVIRGLRKSIQ